jgi:hypothetical protein
MARRIVEQSPGLWSRWFVHLEGDGFEVSFRLHEANVWNLDGSHPQFQDPHKVPTPDMADVVPIVFGKVDYTGDVNAEMPARYLGKVDDVTTLQEALRWALAQARLLMLDEGGYVDWDAI